MDKIFENKFVQKLMVAGQKMGGQKHLQAITGGLMASMSLLLLGAIFNIIANPPITAELMAQGGLASTILGPWYNFAMANRTILLLPYEMTMNLFAVPVSFAIAYRLSNSYKLKALMNGIVSMIIFLLVSSPATAYELADGNILTAMDTTFLGGTGLFTAMIVAIVTVEINRLCVTKKITIRMPDAVPPTLADSFSAVIPLLIDVVIFGGLHWVLSANFGLVLPAAIMALIAAPLGAVTSVPGMLLIGALGLILWLFGIHGTMIVYPLLIPAMMMGAASNAELVAQGLAPVFYPYMIFGALQSCGGTGCTMGAVLLGLRSKSPQIKAVSRASIVPGLFNINETFTFGMPVVLNPVLALPYVLAPLVNMLCTWFAYSIGLIRPGYIMIGSLMPIGVGEFLASMHWMNFVWPYLMIIVTGIIWFPFVKLYERQLLTQAEKAEAEAVKA